jgi:hypothetical protein
MKFPGDLFDGDNDEIIFFIVAFLFLFNGSRSEETRATESDADDKGIILFLIILFGLLFLVNYQTQ